MANYTSIHTGQQVDSSITKVLELVNTSSEINTAVGKALSLDDIEYVSKEAVEGVNYHIIWRVKPTANNSVQGFAMDPNNGQLVIIYSENNIKSVGQLITTKNTISDNEITNLFK